ncbi:hypothetical protein ES703_10460 [subsurface metagenome]
MHDVKGPEWTKHLKGDGVAPSVVWYFTKLPWPGTGGVTIHIKTSLDCQGRSIQASGRWWRWGFGIIIPGRVSYFDGCGVRIRGFEGTPNVFYDLRTVDQMTDLCCPPQLMMEFLGYEGMAT